MLVVAINETFPLSRDDNGTRSLYLFRPFYSLSKPRAATANENDAHNFDLARLDNREDTDSPA